ncbi:MAG: hypothetical protein FGM23_02785 [Alphaproteobacteria bacterium]|nr:hypothetical protein [Alphaproteobacteria bacterium]
MVHKLLLMLFALVAVGTLSACGTTEQPKPIGIGTGNDEYKRSPCACIEVPQDYNSWQQAG